MRARHISLMLLVFFGCSAMQCREAADILESYNFTILKPPSTIYYPGAIIAVNVGQDGKIEMGSLKMTCGPKAALGEHFIATSSHTISESVRRSRRSSWRLSAEAMEHLRSNVDISNVESIEVTLKNARIVSMSDTDIVENVANRSEDCKRAVAARLRAGYTLTVVSESLIADMDYHVNFKSEDKMNARAKAKQISQIGISLGGGITKMSNKKIESRGLTLGIKTDSFLMALSLPEDLGGLVSQKQDSFGEKSLDMKEASISNKPDAPLVLPAGGYNIGQWEAD